MTAQLNLPVIIIPVETRRAEDGLALSSRNGYLSPKERNEAPRLYQNLEKIRQQLSSGEKDLRLLETSAAEDLSLHGWKVDYISIRHADTLQPATPEDRTNGRSRRSPSGCNPFDRQPGNLYLSAQAAYNVRPLSRF